MQKKKIKQLLILFEKRKHFWSLGPGLEMTRKSGDVVGLTLREDTWSFFSCFLGSWHFCFPDGHPDVSVGPQEAQAVPEEILSWGAEKSSHDSRYLLSSAQELQLKFNSWLRVNEPFSLSSHVDLRKSDWISFSENKQFKTKSF